ncbi:MAG: hypothetical protein HOQ02_07095 [Lysobacter sp.]|nr:hypothetical protein [Lysobacter sp.]
MPPRRPHRSPAGDGRAFLFLRFHANVVAAVCMAVAFAATGQVRDSASYLARMDTDGDGRVSLAEYQDWLSYAFDQMDRDHDGVLSPAEQPGGRGAPISRAEYRARLADTFRRQDRNHDGYLDARELAAPPR